MFHKVVAKRTYPCPRWLEKAMHDYFEYQIHTARFINVKTPKCYLILQHRVLGFLESKKNDKKECSVYQRLERNNVLWEPPS